ncbi:MAG TPA: glycosyltransferase family protein [Azospirillum sp.]|nr:glycosyltransferase family protein [Azospirillum sp.]
MRTIAVIQARMTSTRLPGKVLMIAAGRPMLAHQVERVRRSTELDGIVIATTTNATDDPVAEFARSAGVGVFRGSEEDVLGRVHGAAAGEGAELVVRLTGDCPLIDPEIIDRVVDRLRADPPIDYATSGMPRTWPLGLDAEAMTFTALSAAQREAVDPYDREHVTPFIYRQPERFRLASVRSMEDLGRHRWTLDEPADLDLIRRILDALYSRKPAFGYRDVLDLLAEHPDWSQINAATTQKTRLYEDQARTWS